MPARMRSLPIMLERLNANAKNTTVLSSISASSDTVESVGGGGGCAEAVLI